MKQELKKILVCMLGFFFFFASKGWAVYIYDDFSSSANWSINGNAYISSTGEGVLTNSPYQAGSMWYNQAFDLSKYSALIADFDVYLGSNDYGADGVTFAIIDTTNGLTALGAGGGSFGYGGIPNSLAVEFDTYQNTANSDPINDHIGIDQNGSVISLITASTSNLEDGLWHHASVFIDLTVGKVTVVLDNVVYIADYQIGNFTPFNAYIGFTGGTGYFSNLQKVDNMALTLTTPVTAPIPGSALLLGGGLIGFLGIRKKIVQ